MRKVKIYRSSLRFPPTNHTATLDLAELLTNTRDLSLFESTLLQLYILRRWKQSLCFFVLESLFQIAQLLLVFFHVSFFRSPFLLLPLLFLLSWNLAFQVLELKRKGCGFFSDFGNLFDVLTFSLAVLYFSVAIPSDPSLTTKYTLLTLLSLSQGVRAFTLFSLFQSTRTLLRIILEVVKDMVPFIFFVLASTLLISLLFTSSTPDDALSNRTFSHYLRQVLRLEFGDF